MTLVSSGRRRACGLSLIEVLVSLVILSVGTLAVAALQLATRRTTADAGQRTVAAHLLYDLVERMRGNSTPAGLQAYVAGARAPLGRGSRGAAPAATCSTDACDAAQLAAYDLWLWEQALDGATEIADGGSAGGLVLPTACLGSAAGDPGTYRVAIAWRGTVPLPDSGATDCGRGATHAGQRIYGERDEYRRVAALDVFIAAREAPP